MLKKISTVARVKLFYVACSKNGFLPWTMENDQRQLLAQFRSTSNSDISSGALLVVLQDICFPPVLPFGRTCTICLHMQHLTAPAQFYRLRSDFLLPPPAFPQRFSVSWTPASSSHYSDGLALQLAPHIFLFSRQLLLPPFSV